MIHMGHKQVTMCLTRSRPYAYKMYKKSDVVCRSGGDEFLVLLSGLKDYDNFEREIIASKNLKREE